MPADSEPARLRTWRPLGVRLSGIFFSALLLVVSTAAWVYLPADIKAVFTPTQRATTIGLYLAALGVWWAMMRSRVTATEGGLVVVNGFKRRDLEFAQVVSVRLPRGAPWAQLNLSDGTTVPAMGIQGSDGKRAQRAVSELRALIEERSR